MIRIILRCILVNHQLLIDELGYLSMCEIIIICCLVHLQGEGNFRTQIIKYTVSYRSIRCTEAFQLSTYLPYQSFITACQPYQERLFCQIIPRVGTQHMIISIMKNFFRCITTPQIPLFIDQFIRT